MSGPATLQELCAALPARGDRPAVGLRREFGARWWSYRRLYEAACGAAALLEERGVRPGERLLLWAPNSPEWVAYLLGAALRGVVVVPVDEGASPENARRIAEEVGAVLCVHGPEQDAAGTGLPARPIQELGSGPGGSHERCPVPVRPEDPAVILFTSGTTVRPKGVILTHGNLAAQMGAFHGWGRLARVRRLRLLVLAPLSHSQGLLLGACVPLSIGLTVLFVRSIEPAQLVRTIRDNRVHMLATVPRVVHTLATAVAQMAAVPGGPTLQARVEGTRPAALRGLVQRRGLHRLLGDQFRVLFVGGADLSAADERFWRRSGCVLVQGYGLTETAAIVSVNLPWRGRFGSIGRPLGHQTVELAPDGEILVRGPNVSAGYIGGDGDDAALADGVLRTGDLAVRDSRDRMYFLGRKKDVIVTAEGFNVYPDDVEAALAGQPGVRDAAVIGLDRGGSTEVHAALLLYDGHGGADAAQVVRGANAQLESHQLIRSWSVYPDDDFPRTSLLKVKRHEVAARLRSPSPADEQAAPSLEAILALGDRDRRLGLLAAYLARSPEPNGTASRTPSLRELGLSSLETVELLSQIESRTGVSLERVSVQAEADLGDLAVLVRSRGAGAASSRLPVGPPAWSRRPLGRALRGLTRPLVAGLWSLRRGRPDVTRPPGQAVGTRPVIVAAAPHRHWLDGLVVYLALPRRLRRRLLVVTNYQFDEHFAPSPADPRRRRRLVGLMYRLVLPLTFDFVILPHQGTTRYGLYDLGRLIDRGGCPLTFPKGLFFRPTDAGRHDPGVAMIALETQTPVLPLWIEGNDRLVDSRPGPRPPRPAVRFGDLIPVTPAMTRDELVERMETAFRELSGGSQ